MGKYEHSNERFRAVLSCGTVYCIAAQGGTNFLKLLKSDTQMKADAVKGGSNF